jgi:mono/diheme cytochrome c family protein
MGRSAPAGGTAPTSSIAIDAGKRRFRAMNSPVPPVRIAGLGLLLATGMPLSAWAADGAVVYENHCAACHGLDGKARTPAGRKIGARDLSESKLADDAIAAMIRDGLKGPKGEARMPSFSDRLNAEEVSAVAAFVKKFRKK